MSTIAQNISSSMVALKGNPSSSVGTSADADIQQRTFDAIGSNILLSSEASEWVILRETVATGQQTLALAQLKSDAIVTLERLINEFQSHLGSSTEPNDAFDAVSRSLGQEIQNFVEQSAELIPDFYFVEQAEGTENSGDDSIPVTIGSFLDITETIDVSGNLDAIGIFEVSFEDVLNAYHRPENCPICQQAQVAANEAQIYAAATSISGSPSVTGATSFGAGNGNGDRGVDALMMGSAWDLDSNETLTYSLYTGDGTDSHYQYDYVTYNTMSQEAVDAFALTSAQITASRAMAQGWDAVAGFTIEEITENYTTGEVGEIRIANAPVSYMGGGTGPGGTQAYARGPGTANFSGDIWIGDPSVRTYNALLSPGEIGYDTLAHEFGHSIGLKHPQDGSNNIAGANDDTNRYSIMSYGQNAVYDRNLVMVDTGGVVSTKRISAETPMIYDIAAAQYLYGDVTDTNSGDTTYSFTDGEIFIKSIVDAGGTDTVDGSAQSTKSIINLTPGSLSSIGLRTVSQMAEYYESNTSKSAAYWQSFWAANEASWDSSSIFGSSDGAIDDDGALYLGQENFGIASSAIIENAKGGAGNDELTGNDVDNEITGNGGDDTIDGGDGTDTAIYSGNYADYTITQTNTGYTVTDNTTDRDGTDTLTKIENLQFADQTITIGSSSSSSSSTVAIEILHRGSSNQSSGGSYLRSKINSFGFAAPHGMGAFGLLAMLDNRTGKSVNAVSSSLGTMIKESQKLQMHQYSNQLALLRNTPQPNTQKIIAQIENQATLAAVGQTITQTQASRILT